MGAQADGTNGVGFRVCAMGKNLVLPVSKMVLAMIELLPGMGPLVLRGP